MDAPVKGPFGIEIVLTSIIRAGFFLVTGLLLSLYGCGEGPATGVDKKTESPKDKRVHTSPVMAASPKGHMEYVGVLAAHRKVKISTELGGAIEELYFEKGERVREGMLLAEVGTSSVRLQVREAGAAVDAAGSQLKKLEKGSRPQEIQIASSALKEAEAALFEAEKNYKRIKELHDIQAVAGSSYDAAERQVGTAKARMESAKQQLVLALEGPRIEDIKGAQAALAQAEAALALAEDRLRKSILRSPCNGIIAFREVEKGEVIPPGTTITEVIELERLNIKISLSEKDIHILKDHRNFLFTVDAIPGEEFPCRVFFLSPTADPVTRAFPLELIVEKPDPRMADGMTARVKFPVVGGKKAIKVPSAWLSEEDGKIGLFVAKEGKAFFKKVTLGAYYDNRVEILSGLGDKDLVITNPAGLKSGDTVEIGR
ncbi:MAG: efflux RND transporter periplasmic adaptor subunit [Proteobacteria bacterium]|nr:efflux RND transporter periplasmic adaptor subunit [Pseudomonadota bacterium]MBU1902347.1 efflux RND transporter periplasmic adaptor subunit [Pseudomonadota bacterium]